MARLTQILMLGALLAHPSWSIEDHETPKGKPPTTKRPSGENQRPQQAECSVRPGDIADFANGEAYNFRSLVTFITDPVCLSSNRAISQQAMAEGISFNTSPLQLDQISKNYSKMTLDGTRQLERTLINTVPATLRDHPMNTAELLPIVGQLSLLSPAASRVVLTTVIEQELIAADDLISKNSASARDIAKTLMRMGANENMIANELANEIEEKAFMAQAESLAKMFRSLSLAAQVEGALVPTFNISASALSRGIQKGEKNYQIEERKSIASSVFKAIAASATNLPTMESGTSDLNAALSMLLRGRNMDKELVRKVWKDALVVLTKTSSQTALAKTVGFSLTKNYVYLPQTDQDWLIAAARNYPELSFAMQNRYLEAVEDAWDRLHEGKQTIGAFNNERKKFFEPLAGKIVNFEMRMIDPIWLKETVKRGLISDASVEKRFPRFVLTLMERRDKASKIAIMEEGLEPTMTAMAENFSVLTTLYTIHLPALNRWVDRYDEKAGDQSAEPPRELTGQ